MRRRTNTTWWDLANELDVLICDNGPAGCQSGLTQWRHHKGTVRDDIIHWDGFAGRTHLVALRHFMIMVAYAKNPQFLQEPDWLGLYHADRWAFHTEMEVFHVRIPWELTKAYRLRVKRMARKAKVSLRYDHKPIFWWANWKPERAKMRTPVSKR